MVKRGQMGAWVLVGMLWLTQFGAVNAQENTMRLAAGPSQGTLPSPGDRPVDLDQRAVPGQADGGTVMEYRHPLDSPGRVTRAGGGGGGETQNVTPALRGNPTGVDAVPAQPSEGGGGGPAQNQPIWVSPFYMIVPDSTLVPAPTQASPR